MAKLKYIDSYFEEEKHIHDNYTNLGIILKEIL